MYFVLHLYPTLTFTLMVLIIFKLIHFVNLHARTSASKLILSPKMMMMIIIIIIMIDR